MFADTDLSRDGFLGGRLQLWQPLKGYRAATDPVLLAAACPAEPGQTVLDLGCGAGTAALCLAARVPGLVLTGLELQPAYAALARRNAAENGVTMAVVEGDLTAMPAVLRRGFDHVIANPPYYSRHGSPSPQPGRDLALRAGVALSLWVDAAARRLSPGGWLTMILGTDALPQVLAALPPRLGSAALLPLAARKDRPALRVILQARKGGRAAFRLLPPLILHEGAAHDGDRDTSSPKVAAVLRHGAGICEEFSRMPRG